MTRQRKKQSGRPISFDREKVVEDVMHLFWERGYRDVSFSEIAQETGLTRASLYNSFESKEALFLEAIEHYFINAPDTILEHVKPGENVGAALYAMFDTACEARANEKPRRGCMAINCINELIMQNNPLADELIKVLNKRRSTLKKLISQAIKQKELPANTDHNLTMNMMETFTAGFSTFAKTGASEKQMKQLCEAFLDQIGFKKTSRK